MILDENGFLYPEISKDLCISCRKCLKSCSYKSNSRFNKTISVYAAVNKSEKELVKSSSGGVFSVFANRFINNDGVVYGAALLKEDKLRIRHIRVEKAEDLYKIQGSKYVQSDASLEFHNVEKDLKDNKKVLFTGTPCQIDALKGFLKKDYENLLTIDIICHGVPCEKLFQDYISNIEKRDSINIIDYKFRYKNKGQGMSSYIKFIDLKNNLIGERVVNGKTESYVFLFLKSLTYRKNCYTCKYASGNRCSDITIGDFWGFHDEHPSENINIFSNSKGISCLLVNTQKGETAFRNAENDLYLLSSSFEKVARHNNQLVAPSQYDDRRKTLLNIYNQQGYAALDRYFKNKFKKDILREKIIYFLPKSLKRKISYMLTSLKK